jgi:hypothetical protein
MNGSLPLVGFGVTLTPGSADLSDATDVLATETLVSTTGLLDYSTIPVSTNFGATDLNLANLGTFTFDNALYGSWTTTSVGSFIADQSAGFLDVYLLGTFTPSGDLSSFSATLASLRISVVDSGGSISESLSLDSPPASTPEPVTTVLVGSALLALGLLRRKLSA